MAHSPQQIAQHNIRTLTWFNFFVEFKLYAPVAIIYFASVSHSYALGAAVFSIAMIASAFFELPTGILSDRIGRRRTVMLGAMASVVAVVLYALGFSFWFLALGAVFEGLAQSFFSGNNEALLYDSLAGSGEAKEYSHHLGKSSSAFQTAAAIAAVLGSAVAFWSFPVALWLSVVPQLACLVLSFRFIEPKTHRDKGGNIYTDLSQALKNFKINPRLRLLTYAGAIRSAFGEAGFQFQAAFINTLWPLWAIGVARTISNLLAAASYWFSGKVIKRFTSLGTLVLSNLYSRTLAIVALLFPTVASPLLLSSISLAHGTGDVSQKDLLQKEFSSELRATMGSLTSLLGSLLFGIVAVAIGGLADSIGPAKALLLVQIPLLIPTLLYWRIYKITQAEGRLTAAAQGSRG